MGRRSALSIHNKLMLHKQILGACVDLRHTACTGCTKQSNTGITQRLQNKVFRNLAGAPWHIRNADLRRDPQMEMVTNETGKFTKKREERLLHHVNFEAIQLLDNGELVRRLKRKKKKTFELV